MTKFIMEEDELKKIITSLLTSHAEVEKIEYGTVVLTYRANFNSGKCVHFVTQKQIEKSSLKPG